MSPPAPVTVKFTCAICGEVKVPASAVLLVLCTSDPDRSYYDVPCPTCHELRRRAATPEVVLLLSRPGIRVTTFPAEALEPREGPRLTNDDLLDLLLDLRSLETTS